MPPSVTVEELHSLLNANIPHRASGSAFIRAADVPTSAITILTLAPRSGNYRGLARCRVSFDLALATTGWTAIVTTADTLKFYVRRKVDGSNARIVAISATFTKGTTVETAVDLDLGLVDANETVDIQAILSADRGAVEFPYSVVWLGDLRPIVTPRAAA